jgi:hypothetical protein
MLIENQSKWFKVLPNSAKERESNRAGEGKTNTEVTNFESTYQKCNRIS